MPKNLIQRFYLPRTTITIHPLTRCLILVMEEERLYHCYSGFQRIAEVQMGRNLFGALVAQVAAKHGFVLEIRHVFSSMS